LGLNPQNGSARWDTVIANGRGVNEVERLADLVSGVSRVGDSVCLRAFQYAVGCVDARTGRLQWTKLASGATGVGGNTDLVVGAESDGKVIAWRRSDGDKLWTHEKLRFRGLTGASLARDVVALGDTEGNVHFLSPADGSLLQRMSVDGSPIVSAPLWVGSTWVVLTQRGNLIGLRP
jgi:outer membrane protein assembly factor BamB